MSIRPAPRPLVRALAALTCTAALLGAAGCTPAPTDAGQVPEAPADPAAPASSATPSPSASPSPSSEGVLRIGLPAERPGLSVREGEDAPVGADVDTARAVAARLGYADDRIRWSTLPADGLAAALAAGTVDVAVGGLTVEAGAGDAIDVAGPSLAVRHDLLVPADSPVRGPSGLGDGVVCAVEASAALAALEPLLPADAEVLEQQSTAECLTALRSGRVQAVAGDEPELGGLARADDAGDSLRLVGAPFGGVTAYGVGLPEGSTLCPAVTDALVAARADGDWEASMSRLADATGIGVDTALRAAAAPDPSRCS